MENRRYSAEFKERLPEYKLGIIVHRHGPKSGMAGPLSAEGKIISEDYCPEAYKGIVLAKYHKEGVDIEHSPIGRTKETSDIYSNIVKKYNDAKINSVTEDERLSEGTVAEYPDLIDPPSKES